MLFHGKRRGPVLIVIALLLVYIFGGANVDPSQVVWKEHRIDTHSLSNVDLASRDGNGFFNASVATEYCAKHNFAAYPRRNQRRKIYDLFMVNTELDWLEIRLNELNDHVDYFVILEGEKTFTGLSKPLYVKDNWKQFKKFHDKIILRVLDESNFQSTRTWDHEDLQRNAMFDQVLSPKNSMGDSPGWALTQEQLPEAGDVILVSDIDEIPKPQALTILRNCDFPRRLTLRSRFYYYSFQWLHRGEEWPHPQATFYEGENTVRPADLRNGEGSYGGRGAMLNRLDKADLWNSSWHCSTCFSSIEETTTKLASFSHTTLNQEAFRQPGWVVNRVRNGLDLFNRETEFYDKIKGKNWDVPQFLLHYMDSTSDGDRRRFAHLLDRDPPNANFVDLSMDEAGVLNLSTAPDDGAVIEAGQGISLASGDWRRG